MVKMKSRRHHPCAEEVISKWWTLSADAREKVMTFDDNELVSEIQYALRELQLNHETLVAAGLTEDSDPFKSTLLLAEAFSFHFDGKRSSNDPTLALVAAHTSVMTMTDRFLAREDLFDQLKLVLPDFLSPKSGSKRTRLPRSSWKQLWEVVPSSFIALEQNLVKTAEQALWAMASDIQCVSLAAEPVPSPPVGDLNEDWMDEDVSDVKFSKACSKTGKKKRKQKARAKSHSSNSTACPSSGTEDLAELTGLPSENAVQPFHDTDQADACSDQADACSEFASAGFVVPSSVSVDSMRNATHASLQEVKGEAVMRNTCSDDYKVLDKPELGLMAQKVVPRDQLSPIAPPQSVENKEWSTLIEPCGPLDLSQSAWTPWQSIESVADMKSEDSEIADVSSDTSQTANIEELAVSMVDKIYADQDDEETECFTNSRARYVDARVPLTMQFAEDLSGAAIREAAEDKLQMGLDCTACIETNLLRSYGVDANASTDDMHESSKFQHLVEGHQVLATGPPPGLDIPDGLSHKGSFISQVSPVHPIDASDAALIAENKGQENCDLKLALTNFLAHALESTPEQLMQFSHDAPPKLSVVYRDLLNLQSSLASAFP